MTSKGIKNVFGGGPINPERGFGDLKVLQEEAFPVLLKGECPTIDTAALYGESESILGKANAGKQFTIDTKMKGGFGGKGYATKAKVIEEAEQSHKLLGTNVDVYYIHAPDGDTDIADTLAGINEVHKKGFFKRFGLSNYKAEDVKKVYEHCEKHGYIKPTVYQGNYSAVARKQEELLFPTLRELGISFYAYSPMAGGFLTKTKQDITDGKGRFDPKTPLGDMYSSMYGRPKILEVLEKWEAIAKEEGTSRADLAYRWVKYNSALKPEHGDAIIIGSRSIEQLKETLDAISSGPLSDKAAKQIDDLWHDIKDEAPLDNYHR